MMTQDELPALAEAVADMAKDLRRLRERRVRARFPIQLPFLYRLVGLGGIGSGITVNLSSQGILAVCPDQLPLGACIELSILWPFLLEGSMPLCLTVTGSIIRCHSSGFAMLFSQHNFRRVRAGELAASGFFKATGTRL